MLNFLACGRCSFFLAGYRVIHGTEELERAASSGEDAWLSLSWDAETRRLTQHSYGCRLDIDLTYFDGRCRECQRRFVVETAEKEGEPNAFRIALITG